MDALGGAKGAMEQAGRMVVPRRWNPCRKRERNEAGKLMGEGGRGCRREFPTLHWGSISGCRALPLHPLVLPALAHGQAAPPVPGSPRSG